MKRLASNEEHRQALKRTGSTEENRQHICIDSEALTDTRQHYRTFENNY